MQDASTSARGSGDAPEQRTRAARAAERDPSAAWGFVPGHALHGDVVVPGSKSIAQRILVCAGLSANGVSISGLPDGDDVRHACALIAECGALVDHVAPSSVHVRGLPPGPHRGWAPSRPVAVGESGTLARLATAALALCGRAGSKVEVRAEGSLRRRHSRALFDALRRAEIVFERGDDADELDAASRDPVDARATGDSGSRVERWPVKFVPLGPPSDLYLRDPSSSQEVSALLIALAAYPDALYLHVQGAIPSRPYVELTLAVLEAFGVRVDVERATAGAELFHVRGPLRAPDANIPIEPDASSAAVALAAACLSDGRVSIPGLSSRSRQGDLRIVEYLQRMGSRAGLERDRAWAGGFPERPIDVDLTGEPDLAPVIAALAAGVAGRAGGGTSRITGLATLAGKESSRIEVLARGLSELGFEVGHGADFLTVGPPRGGANRAARADSSRAARADSSRAARTDSSRAAGADSSRAAGADSSRAAGAPAERLLDPEGDHRMAFAFALVSLFVEGVRVRDAHCVSKSWPRFWSDMQRVGARIAR